MAEKEFILFCDESEKDGAFFSNFYGGVLVGGSQHKRISDSLNAIKGALHLHGEVKWEKVTERYLPKYEELTRAFFKEVASGSLKVRIMFRQNAHEPKGLTTEHIDLQYFMLYYQFIKHGFGLAHLDNDGHDVNLRIYFDRFPDTRERAAQFKGHIHALQETHRFGRAHIHIRMDDIQEVHSHDHVLLQCLDIVLGSMAFRLNDKHKVTDPATGRRGNRTRAKESLYKTILAEIRSIRPGFNAGITTGQHAENAMWVDAYRHWSFKARSSEFNRRRTKRGQKKNPAEPTSVSDA